ncbi:MAG: hypothetical protein KGK16_07360 [Bradyrhizobium sp.]|nr:hypothetical protein [Bradyrhizobium sp.]
MRIGIDFDNTIARYDDVFVEAARGRSWVASGFRGTKKQLRDTVRKLDDGEIKWQKLQAEVYGPRMQEAVPFPGVLEFFEAAHRRGFSLFIVSHKTHFANYAEEKVDLREAALRWMEVTGLFEYARSGLLRANVFFADTRDEKVARIAALGCNVFIDDLEEVFAHPDFPGDVRRILFSSGNERPDGGSIEAHESWAGISRHVLGGEHDASAGAVPEVTNVAANLAGRPIRSLEPVRAGGNNRLFAVSCDGGARFALKQYPRQASDSRDRLATEFRALQFMRQHGVTQVPAALASDPAAGFALYDWIDGRPPVASVAAVDAAITFTRELQALGGQDGASEMPEASEACFSPATIVAQVERRLSMLKSVTSTHPELGAFLNGPYAAAATRAIGYSRTLCRDGQLDFDASIDPGKRCLSPSDFGFHNALACPDGRLVFLDFEYFGWDDPVKLTSDFLLHPGMNLPDDLGRHFHAGMMGLFGDDDGFATRLRGCLPLYALRWTMILLNEFLPDRWARRVMAGVEGEHEQILSRQLDKARAMIARIETGMLLG